MSDIISGVKRHKLKQFHDERGKVMHMMRTDAPYFEKFGEIYFSCSFPNVVKAWHKHTEMTLNYAVISGIVKVVLFDDREESDTNGLLNEFFLSPENYYLLTVPPGVWNGFKAIGGQMAILANCATIPHSKEEILRMPFDDPYMNYDWDVRHF